MQSPPSCSVALSRHRGLIAAISCASSPELPPTIPAIVEPAVLLGVSAGASAIAFMGSGSGFGFPLNIAIPLPPATNPQITNEMNPRRKLEVPTYPNSGCVRCTTPAPCPNPLLITLAKQCARANYIIVSRCLEGEVVWRHALSRSPVSLSSGGSGKFFITDAKSFASHSGVLRNSRGGVGLRVNLQRQARAFDASPQRFRDDRRARRPSQWPAGAHAGQVITRRRNLGGN